MAVRVAEAGVGLSLPPNHFTPRRFSNTVLQMLNPQAGFSFATQELRRYILSNPAGLGRTQGADVIEDILRRGSKYRVPLEVLVEPGWAKVGLDVMILDVMAILLFLWVMKLIGQNMFMVMWRVVRSPQTYTGHPPANSAFRS